MIEIGREEGKGERRGLRNVKVAGKVIAVKKLILSKSFTKNSILAINPGYEQSINMHTCLTICVEKMHACNISETMTMLQYARNLGNTVTEGLKKSNSMRCALRYYTHSRSYYPVPEVGG